MLEQTAPPGRLIVVDDGSSDDTLKRLEGWRQRHTPSFPLDILAAPHGGAAAARNRGMEAAEGAGFLAFLDCDDLWPSDFLARTRGEIGRGPASVACSCDQLFVRLPRGVEKSRSLAGITGNHATWLFTHHAGIASASLFRAEPLRRLGGFPEAVQSGHDLDLFLRLGLLGPWCHAPGGPVIMRRGRAEQLGEERSNRNLVPHHQRCWAEIFESFLLEQGGSEVVPAGVAHRVLARQWRRAGRQQMRHGSVEEARRCFRRSLRWQRWNRAWLRLGLSYFSL